MKRERLLITLVLILFIGFQGAFTQDGDWNITLNGVREDMLKSSLFEEAKQHGSHYVKMRLERKGKTHLFAGMPLIQIAAMVDGPEDTHPYKVERSLWRSGYDITVTASDGYSKTFNTAEIPMDAIILADTEDGQPIPPTIVGKVPTSYWVKGVAEIELSLAAAQSPGPSFELVMDINGKISAFSLQELETSPHYVEGKGSYTTSAGTTYSYTYGGVKLPDLLEQFMNLEESDTVTFVAMDGYQMSYGGSQILDRSDGVWILAFKRDGEYLPEDPGFVRTVKVGPNNPNILGHLSVRMVERIVVKEEGYRDFTLRIEGRMSHTIDRQTMQSGVSCHKRTVFFERKNVAANYTGIPLWRLLAYSDDPKHAPHKQDSSIISYRKQEAKRGYRVELEASDGFKITLDSRELDGNDDVIIAMYREGSELPDNEFPLVLVWDRDTRVVPKGIKPIRQITAIRLRFD